MTLTKNRNRTYHANLIVKVEYLLQEHMFEHLLCIRKKYINTIVRTVFFLY